MAKLKNTRVSRVITYSVQQPVKKPTGVEQQVEDILNQINSPVEQVTQTPETTIHKRDFVPDIHCKARLYSKPKNMSSVKLTDDEYIAEMKRIGVM